MFVYNNVQYYDSGLVKVPYNISSAMYITKPEIKVTMFLLFEDDNKAMVSVSVRARESGSSEGYWGYCGAGAV